MRILLLNANPVVSRLIALAAANKGAVVEEVTHLSHISSLTYDAVLIDDASYDEEAEALLSAVRTPVRIFFSGRNSNKEATEAFDEVLTKPFLPSQVEALLARCETNETSSAVSPYEDASQQEDSEEEEEEHFFFLEEETLESSEPVLDEAEVARIKALLEESERDVDETIDTDDTAAMEARKVEAITENLKKEGLEIVEESEMIEDFAKTPVARDTLRMDAESFVRMLQELKPKKLRKLLKGATVTLTIEFKD